MTGFFVVRLVLTIMPFALGTAIAVIGIRVLLPACRSEQSADSASQVARERCLPPR